jgi:hypothetical protein
MCFAKLDGTVGEPCGNCVTERCHAHLGYKQRFQNAVNDAIGLEPGDSWPRGKRYHTVDLTIFQPVALPKNHNGMAHSFSDRNVFN